MTHQGSTVEAAARAGGRRGYRFESFEAMEEALISLVRWPDEDEEGDAHRAGGGGDWRIRCRKVEAGYDPKYVRFVCLTGMAGNTKYYIYQNLPLSRQDPRKRIYSWEHFRDASVLLELLVAESATLFGGSMRRIVDWLSEHAESIIDDTRYGR